MDADRVAETLVSTTIKGAVGFVTMQNPQQRNALSQAMMLALADALRQFEKTEQVRAIIITAEGTVFCAGHDLKELDAHRRDNDKGQAFFIETMRLCTGLMLQIVRHPKPIIAEIGGIATAAGCQLVASCDLAIASNKAQFATPGVNIGLFCSTPMVALSRNVSRKHAMEMLLLGDMIDAATAKEFGLVNKIVPHDELRATTNAFAQRLAEKPALTITRGKSAFYEQCDMSLTQAYEFTGAIMVENMLAADAKEGISAFIEKRKPAWE
ncbi:MAG: enoyl-CoA hydratase [Alphaproteobacteria bacterium]|nr:enoyl-CoA hydratase [Alphaproteobacteria bacterium]